MGNNTITQVASPLSDPSTLHSLPHALSMLCMAGLIEYLNKLINHRHAVKMDRSREVMFIKLPPIPILFP